VEPDDLTDLNHSSEKAASGRPSFCADGNAAMR
jgi:hypothetical protein